MCVRCALSSREGGTETRLLDRRLCKSRGKENIRERGGIYSLRNRSLVGPQRLLFRRGRLLCVNFPTQETDVRLRKESVKENSFHFCSTAKVRIRDLLFPSPPSSPFLGKQNRIYERRKEEQTRAATKTRKTKVIEGGRRGNVLLDCCNNNSAAAQEVWEGEATFNKDHSSIWTNKRCFHSLANPYSIVT